jgi:hypothetical protein
MRKVGRDFGAKKEANLGSHLTFFVFGSYFWSQIIQQTFFFG